MATTPEEVRGFEQAVERALERVLARAAFELGANSLAVLALGSGGVEIVCCPSRSLRGPLAAAGSAEVYDVLAAAPESISAQSPVARFLTSALAPDSNSFILMPCHVPRPAVSILLGFAALQPAYSEVPPHSAESLGLAALAAWSLIELNRLRTELRSVNQSLAGRKLVHRAKCLLQSERGMDEQQAYEYLRKLSRQRRVPMPKLAERLLGAGAGSLKTDG
jgi:hypothetical protein